MVSEVPIGIPKYPMGTSPFPMDGEQSTSGLAAKQGKLKGRQSIEKTATGAKELRTFIGIPCV
jgi:hypothetical protein